MRGPGAAIATLILMLAIAAGAFALAQGRRARPHGRRRPRHPLLHARRRRPPPRREHHARRQRHRPDHAQQQGRQARQARAHARAACATRPGLYGGRLSSVLRLRIDDLTSGGAPVETTLARATPLPLADLKGRQARTYKVTATFPDTGVPAGPGLGDNAQQGSSVEVAMTWQLTETDPAVPKPPARPATPPAPAPSSRPPRRRTPSGQPPTLVTLRVPAQRVIKPRKLKVYASCELRCKLKFSAKIDNAPKPRPSTRARRPRSAA